MFIQVQPTRPELGVSLLLGQERALPALSCPVHLEILL